MAKARSIGAIFAELSLDDRKFREGAKRAKMTLKEIQGGGRGGLVNRDRAGVGGGMDFKAMATGAGSLATGVLAAASSFYVMTQAMKAVLETYAQYDSMIRGLKLLDGTATATASRLEELRAIAKSPGLGFEEVVQGDIRLRSAGLSADESAKAIKGFGNALAAVGGSKADLSGVFLALGQISAKGKVSAEEINQLAERVPQIRQLMKSAFGTADTEAIQAMGIESKAFITGIINELELLPRATGGARNDLDNYGDAWSALKAQASEFGAQIAGPWVKSITGAFAQARRDLLGLKGLMGLETAGLGGADTQTEAQRIAEKEAEAQAKILADSQAAENRVHNENLAFWQAKQEERTAFLKDEAEKRLAIEAEKQQRRADAMALYNEESAIVTARLSGDKAQVDALEKQKAIREKIAELVGQGFTKEEAAGPAAAMVDAMQKLEAMEGEGAEPRESRAALDVNEYQRRGLSLGGSVSRPNRDELKTLQSIDKTLKEAKKTGALNWD